eukprot:Nitzschia sp. Nitz4//scaffold4_size323378//130710//133639//NITZ4_000653-RA/size323378-processed-gene-0.95-mRNA-1//1//CDS//3329553378//354//frame0
MGQCSTLPTAGRNEVTKRGDSSMTGDESEYNDKRYGKRHSSIHHGQASQYSPHAAYGHPQSRNPETHMSEESCPMDEDEGRDGIPQPPEIATRTRCYKLNLDSAIVPQPTAFLGPFADVPPPLTYSTSDDSGDNITATQIAIQTAQIFRGITVAKDGTILSQNARATRSSRGSSKNKRGEQSRQATKIEKARDLVEETILTGKAPDSDEPANMMSLVPMGEYDDMKYLVRDGAKKLREASEHPDETLLAINRGRAGPVMTSPRMRASPNYVAGQRSAAQHMPNKMGYSNSEPPRLKGHPRDGPSTRKLEEKSRSRGQGYPEDSRGRVDGDWSNTLSFSRGFHSIWNCGGNGEDTGTISPTQVANHKLKRHMTSNPAEFGRPVFEGRGDSSFGQAREGAMLCWFSAGMRETQPTISTTRSKSWSSVHAHWFVATAQLVVGIVWSMIMWATGLRKTPNLSAKDIADCIPIGLFACLAHCGSVLASAVGAVSFAQIVKACEPVFAAAVGLLIPPMDVKPILAYLMLVPIVGGVGIACVKEGKGVDINVEAFLFASMANAAAALKGKLGSSVTKALKADPSKNMDAANVYAVMNIISFLCSVPFVVVQELPTLGGEWNKAVEEHGLQDLMYNIIVSGFMFYIYNEFAFAFTSHVGAVTSSVLNTAKRVIIIVAASVVFQEAMERNTVIGSAIAITGTFAYSLASKKPAPKAKTA